MNLKKYIRLKKDISQERQMTEEEQALYNSLLARVESNSAVAVKPRANLWKVLAIAISFVGAIAIVLTCIFTLNKPNDIVYNHENVKSEESTFIAMQSDIQYFDLTFIEPYADQIYMAYDTRSRDKLYYSAFADIELSTINLIVVINDKYNYEFDLKNEPVNIQLSDYLITYSSVTSRGDPQINYKGWIKVNTETVYFDYIQMPALGDEAFFDSIQQIIKLK